MPNSWKKWSVAFVLLALAVGTGACRKEGKSAGARRRGTPNLLLITLDTTRADRIGAYGDTRARTPNLDRLAREGARVERAYAEAPLTLPSHVSILTGREPPSHLVRNNGTYALRAEETTLAEILKNAGYSTQAMVAAFVLERKFGLVQGFDGYDDTLDKERPDTTYRSEITADRVHEKFTRWLSNSPVPPFFCWVHFYDPHAPYEPPSHLRERFHDTPYRGEIAFMDETIGHMLDELDQRGLLDNTLVVAVGDHGEGFGEHAESGHGLFCYEETLRVPLILHFPKGFPGGRIVRGPVGLTDVLPTVLELLHLPPVAGVQGRSFARQLTGGAGGNDSAIHYFESLYGMEEMGFAPLSGLIRGSLKFISLPRPELYDLAADPGERDNLYLKRNVLAKRMARELDDHLAAVVKTGSAALRPPQSREDQSRLQALGYLASTNSRIPAGGGEDPKDGIGTMNLLVNAREAIRAGKLEEAERQLAALKARGIDRRLAQFHDTRYELALARKNPTITEAVLREAIARFPDEPRFLLILSAFYRDHGNERGTEETSLRLIERDPQAVEPHLLLGELYRRRKRTGPALAHFQRAWELRPDDPKLALALTDMQIEAGHPERALTTLKSLLQGTRTGRNPLKTEIRSQAAKLLVALGEPGMAEDLLQGLVRERGSNPEHWTQLGLAQLGRGQGDQALHSFQQALRLAPNQSLALSGLGTLHLTRFRQQKDRQSLSLASEYFGRAVAADPKLVTAMNGLGVVCLYQGDAPRAIEQFRAAIRVDPVFVNTYFNLAIAQLSLGRRVAARQTLKTIQTKLATRLSADEKNQLAALSREAGI